MIQDRWLGELRKKMENKRRSQLATGNLSLRIKGI